MNLTYLSRQGGLAMRDLLLLAVLLAAPIALGQTVSRSQSCLGAAGGACITADAVTESTDQMIVLNPGFLYDVIFDPDTETTGTATCQIDLYGPCADLPDDATDFGSCEKLYLDADLLGGLESPTLTGDASAGTRVRWGIPGGAYIVDFQAAPGSGEICKTSFQRR